MTSINNPCVLWAVSQHHEVCSHIRMDYCCGLERLSHVWVEQVSRSVAMVLDLKVSLCFKISALRGQSLHICHPSDLKAEVTSLHAAFDLKSNVSREIRAALAVKFGVNQWFPSTESKKQTLIGWYINSTALLMKLFETHLIFSWVLKALKYESELFYNCQ